MNDQSFQIGGNMRYVKSLVLFCLFFAPVCLQAAIADPLKLERRLGIGLDNIPGASASATVSLLGGSMDPNALSVRYWFTDTLCWEGLLAGSVTSQPGGSSVSNTASGNSNFGFGIGTAIKYNFRQPARGVFVQFLGRGSLAVLGQRISNGADVINTVTTNFTLFAGTGFEAFIPV
jgi:hypothetical protein